MGLAWLASVVAFGLGVPFWINAAALALSAIPTLAGMFMRGSVEETNAQEIELALWIGIATIGSAATGLNAPALLVVYALAIVLAAQTGRKRLTVEAAAFSGAGVAVAALAGMGGVVSPWAETLGLTFGAAALAAIGWALVQGVKPARVVVEAPSVDPALTLRLRQTEERLLRSAAAAMEAREETVRAKAELAGRMQFFAQTSHELRTPLNAIVGFSDMMRQGLFGPLPERYQEYAQLIHEGGNHLTLVVDDVLDLAKIEAGKYEISKDVVSLTDLAAEAVGFMQAEAARVKVTLSLDEDDDAEAFADSKAVRQIALNLISNALKFTPQGGVVSVKAFEATGGAWLAVSDTGAGMSVEELKTMSEAFRQGAAGKKTKGTGLGLSVVRAFAELHDGRLDIESREGGGTTVAVFFPHEKSTA